MGRIANAAPMFNSQGTEDLSPEQLVIEAEALPQHLPLYLLFTKKGPLSRQLCVGAVRSNIYGADSFDVRKPYANHATVFCNETNKQANSHIIQRLKPNDAGPNASVRFSIDKLSVELPEFERNADGSFKLDNDGAKIPTGATIPSHKVKWVVEPVGVDEDGGSLFGLAERMAGDQVDVATATQSERIPMFEVQCDDFGKDGNNRGLRLWAPTTKSSDSIDPAALEDALTMAYPFRLACVYKETDISTPKVVRTLYGEQNIDVVFKPGVLHPDYENKLSLDEAFIDAYQDLESQTAAPTFGPFGQVHVYHENLEEVLAEFYAAEKDLIGDLGDFDGSEGEEYRFNFISGTTSTGVPYHSFVLNTTDANAVRLSENSTIYAMGGSDGTMNDEVFAQLVSEAVKEYGDPLSPFQDTARHPESIIYDSGFPVETKFDLFNFISLRKDTSVAVSTYIAGKKAMSASEDSSLAIALRTRAQMYPESEYFGTEAMRAIIIGRSGKILSSQWADRVPLTYEVASKAAKYMGAGNGIWKSIYNFDHAPLSVVTLMHDVKETFTPASVRNKDWAAGLNWAQSYDRKQNFIPALKTVYGDDTSVLTSWFTMLACCYCQKVGEMAWREYSGQSSLTKAQLKEQVEEFVIAKLKDKFHDRFVIVPEVYFTEADNKRGYSWSLRIKLWANNMTTVMSFSVQADRLDRLLASAG